MQAASIVMNLLSTKTASPGNIPGSKPAPGAPSFVEALANKVLDAQPAGKANPRTAPPKASLPADSASPVTRATAKKSEGKPAEIGSQPGAIETILVVPAMSMPAVPNQNVPGESANSSPEQIDSQMQDGSQAGGTKPLSAAQSVSQDMPQNVSQSASHNVSQSVTQGVAAAELIAMPQVPLPVAAIVAPPAPEQQKNATAAQNTPPDPPAPNGGSAAAISVPQGARPEPVAALPDLPDLGGTRREKVSPKQAAPAFSPETKSVVITAQTAILDLLAKPASPEKNANSVPKAYPQADRSREQSIPENPPAPVDAFSAQPPAANVGKEGPSVPVISQKNVAGANDSSPNTILTAVSAAPIPPLKTTDHGSMADSHGGSFQDSQQQKEANTPPPSTSPRNDTDSSKTVTPVDQKTANAARSVPAAPVVRATNANVSADTGPSPASSVLNQAVREHASGQTALTDTILGDSHADAPPRAPQNADAPDLQEAHGITNAHIVGNTAQSEIHIALDADKLGSMELHARVTGEQVGAAIVVEKKEAHAALAVELPALQQALTEKNLRVEHVWLTQSPLHSTEGDTGSAAGENPRHHAESGYQGAKSEEPLPFSLATSLEGGGIFDDQGRLSVRV